jgi:uncharacterized membrane protein YtjA (UPF0391 family)
MFGLATAFLVVAIVSGVFAYTGLAGIAVPLANGLFVFGLLAFAILLVLAWLVRRVRV